MARTHTATSTLILSRSDVVDLLSLRDCIEAAERAFRLHAEGRTFGPGVLGIRAADGSFHIKAAGLTGERSYFAAKTNANFPGNPSRVGLPTIQGAVLLADASTGEPLAVMDSASVTALRTGAATAVAAKLLARRDARTATIVGCNAQGEVQLAAIAAVLPLQHAWVLDTEHARAERLAAHASASLWCARRGHERPPSGASPERRVRHLHVGASRVPDRAGCRAGNLHCRGRRGQPGEAGAGAGARRLRQLTPREFVDGLALGQLTPGPVLMLAAYVIGVMAVALARMAPYAAPDWPAAAALIVTAIVLVLWRLAPLKVMAGGSVFGASSGPSHG
jgi:hypothetical protein